MLLNPVCTRLILAVSIRALHRHGRGREHKALALVGIDFRACRAVGCQTRFLCVFVHIIGDAVLRLRKNTQPLQISLRSSARGKVIQHLCAADPRFEYTTVDASLRSADDIIIGVDGNVIQEFIEHFRHSRAHLLVAVVNDRKHRRRCNRHIGVAEIFIEAVCFQFIQPCVDACAGNLFLFTPRSARAWEDLIRPKRACHHLASVEHQRMIFRTCSPCAAGGFIRPVTEPDRRAVDELLDLLGKRHLALEHFEQGR